MELTQISTSEISNRLPSRVGIFRLRRAFPGITLRYATCWGVLGRNGCHGVFPLTPEHGEYTRWIVDFK